MREEPFGPIAVDRARSPTSTTAIARRQRDRLRVRGLPVHRLAAHAPARAGRRCARATSASTRWRRRCPTRRSAACRQRLRLRGRPRRHRRVPAPPADQRDGRSGLSGRANPPTKGRSSMHSRIRAAAFAAIAIALAAPAAAGAKSDLWKVYDQTLSKARYIDLTHTLTPDQPVWSRLRPGDLQAGGQSGHRAALHLRDGRLRGDRVHDRDRPVRHAVRPAGALGARAGRDRRGARELLRPPARRDQHRAAGQAGPEVLPHGRRRARMGAAARPHPGRLGRDGALGLVQALDHRPGQGEGARRRRQLPERRRSTR